jgi:hypothetical protein
MPCLSLVEVRKHRRLLLVAILVSVLGVACIYLASDREPRYQGKELSVWLELSSDPGNPGYPAEGPRADEARFAIAAIGTNAVPLLVKWISYERPRWKERTVRILARKGRWVLSIAWNLIWKPLFGDVQRGAMAPVAFAVYGEEANFAVPELTRVARRQGMSAWAAIKAMGFTGTSALPVLKEMLADETGVHRYDVAIAIGSIRNLGPETAATVEFLVPFLHDKNARARSGVATALGMLSAEPGVVVPALKRALLDPDADTRKNAVWALRHFPGQKAMFVSELKTCLADIDSSVRDEAKNALSEISE